MIPIGTYRARGTEAVLAETKNGDPQIAIDFVITQGEHEGQHLMWRGFFTEKTTNRTIESLEHCGWSGTDLTDLSGIDTNEVDLVVEHEEFTDQETGETRTSAKVRWVNAIGGISRLNPMEAATGKAFAAKMKGHILAHRAKKKGGGPARANGGSPPVDNTPMPGDDSIPF